MTEPDIPVECEDCGLTFLLRKDTGICSKCSKLAKLAIGSPEYEDASVCNLIFLCRNLMRTSELILLVDYLEVASVLYVRSNTS